MKKTLLIAAVLLLIVTSSFAAKIKFPADFAVTEKSAGIFSYDITPSRKGLYGLKVTEFLKNGQKHEGTLFSKFHNASDNINGEYQVRQNYSELERIVFTICRENNGNTSCKDRVFFISGGSAVKTRPKSSVMSYRRKSLPLSRKIYPRMQYAVGDVVTIKGFLKVLRKDGDVSTVFDSIVKAYDEDMGVGSKVELVTIPAEVKTDINGYFEFQITNADPSEGGTGVDLILEFNTTNADNVNLYIPEGVINYNYTLATQNDICEGVTVKDFGTIQVDGTAAVGSYEYENAAALNVFSVSAKSAKFYFDASGTKTSNLTVYWAVGYLDGDVSHYENSILRIEGYADDPDEWDDGIVAHEFGHFVYDNFATDATFPGAYGAHSMNEPTLSNNAIAANMAWSEGWAHFYALGVLGTTSYKDTNDTSENVYEFESIGNIKSPIIERVVAATLLDMYDANNDADDSDAVSVSFGRIVSVLKNFDPNTSNDDHDNVWSLVEFWVGWQSLDGNDLDAIADIFRAHGIVIPLSPAYNSAVTTIHPDLEFTVPNGASVEIQYSLYRDFTLDVTKITNITTEKVTLSGLSTGRKYYWRAISQTPNGYLYDTAMHEDYPTTGWSDDTAIQKPTAITSFIPSGGILDSSIVFLIDIAKTVESPSKLNLLKRTLKVFIDSANESDEFSIVTFEKDIAVELLPLTKIAANRDNMKTIVDTMVLSINPERNFKVGLSKAHDICKTINSVNRQIIMIGSGVSDDTSYLATLAQIIDDEIGINTIFDSTGLLAASSAAAWTELKNLAISTGGLYRYAGEDSLYLSAFSLSAFLRFSTSEITQYDGLNNGGEVEYEVEIEANCNLLRFYLADYAGGKFAMKVTSPEGKVYEELSGYPELTVRTTDSSYYIFQISDSITSGIWRIHVEKNGNGVNQFGVVAEAQYTDSNIATFMEKNTVISGDSSALFLKYFGTKDAFTFQTIVASYIDPATGAVSDISFNDSGNNDDVKSGDGIYTATISLATSASYPILIHEQDKNKSALPNGLLNFTVFENALSNFSNTVFINLAGIKPSPFENDYITETKPLLNIPFSGNADAAYNIEFDITSDKYGKSTLKNELVTLNKNVFVYQFLSPLNEEVYLMRVKANPEVKWKMNISVDAPYIEEESPEDGAVVHTERPVFTAILKDDSTSIDPDSISLVINGISYEVSSSDFSEATGIVSVSSPVGLTKGTVEWYFYCRDKVGTPVVINKISFTKKDRFHMDPAEFYGYPNPFNPLKESMKIRYKLASDSIITMRLYDVNGRLVSIVMSEALRNKGVNTELWDGKNDVGDLIANGVYFAKITGRNEDSSETISETLYKKLVILK